MSDQEEDLEVQALQRQLDDAFATTRPRRGFEDELWARMQEARPAPNRLRDAIAGLWHRVWSVSPMPAAAVAALLVVVLGVGFLAYGSTRLHLGGGGATSSLSSNGASRNGDQTGFEGFGIIPSPVFGNASATTAPTATKPQGMEYPGPVQLVWAGIAAIFISGAPVFRYREPTNQTADQFATQLGAVLRGRPQGFLGSYSSSDYTLKVRGTVQAPPSSPAYFIFASLAMQPIQAAGASQSDIANIFLAEHNLVPPWNYTVRVDASGDPVKVVYERQLDVPGFGPAHIVDSTGTTYGLEVDLSNNRPVIVSGMLPMNFDGAYYNLATPAQAIAPALTPPNTTTVTPAPTIQLTQVSLVYVLVPAGDHSFFEPAYLYTGTLQMNGVTYTKHVLEPAVDPSQRTA